MTCGCQQEILEMTQNVRTDGVALITSDQQVNQIRGLLNVLSRIDVEVVVPEVQQHFFELVVRIYSAKNLGLLEVLAGNQPGRPPELGLAAQLWNRSETLRRKL